MDVSFYIQQNAELTRQIEGVRRQLMEDHITVRQRTMHAALPGSLMVARAGHFPVNPTARQLSLMSQLRTLQALISQNNHHIMLIRRLRNN